MPEALQLRQAERKKTKLRIGIFGPSGSGKTYSAIQLAKGITTCDKIAIIDTENGSADLYSHLGDFSVLTIEPPFSPERYIEAIRMCEKAGKEVIIIDSISHEWEGTGGMLSIADSMEEVMRDGRKIWAKITPRHNSYIDAIRFSKANIICCGRSEQEKVIQQKMAGNMTTQAAEKIGMKAITRKGFEYEMMVAFDLAMNHYATCSKDRTKDQDGKAIFQDRPPHIINEATGKRMLDWANEGKDDPNVITISPAQMAEIEKLTVDLNAQPAAMQAWIKKTKGREITEITQTQAEEVIKALKTRVEQKAKETAQEAETNALIEQMEALEARHKDVPPGPAPTASAPVTPGAGGSGMSAEDQKQFDAAFGPTPPEPTYEPIVETPAAPPAPPVPMTPARAAMQKGLEAAKQKDHNEF